MIAHVFDKSGLDRILSALRSDGITLIGLNLALLTNEEVGDFVILHSGYTTEAFALLGEGGFAM